MTKETSRPKNSSSQHSTQSFDQVFGKPHPNQEEITKLDQLLAAAVARLSGLQKQPEPTLALYRARLRGKISKEKSNIRDITEALRAANAATTPTA